ncbi:MAG: TIGR00730 family Rossman fold protein, partial [Propionibacteriaceae bacterium]|nr:TIGR00730 family Rossman fold protein [Propionibacteriaceae bacterium]
MAKNYSIREQGGVIRRGSHHEALTTDQQLLDTRDDWKNGDPWRVMRIQAEFVEGFENLSGIKRAISVFGSARCGPEDPYYQMAYGMG